MISPEEQRIRALLLGAWVSRAVTSAVELGVFDALAEGPLDAPALAIRIGGDQPADVGLVQRLLDFLVDHEIVAHDAEGYWLTDASELLVEGTERSLAPMARLVGAHWHTAAWSALPHAILAGTSGYEAAHGRSLFSALQDDPDAALVFSRGVAPKESDNALLASLLPIADDAHIVDIGGGDGGFVASLLVDHPRRRGTVFDLPSARAAAHQTLEARGVAERVSFVQGSFFDQIPEAGDTYLLRWVLHNWSDDDALTILTRVSAAMGDDASLYVTELVLPERGPAPVLRSLDIDMMVLLRGRERSLGQFRSLFHRAGLAIVDARTSGIGFTILTVRRRVG